MSGIKAVVREFDGHQLRTIFWEQKPCWLAKEVGQTLGYGNNGQKLTHRITQDWADEFIEGKDFAILDGDELLDFKELFRDMPKSGISFAARLLVLFESGIDMVCAKTTKPIGRQLRRWLVDEVLPQIRRTGGYKKEYNTDELEEHHACLLRQLSIQEQQIAQRQREFATTTLDNLLDYLDTQNTVAKDVLQAHRIVAAEIATGRNLNALKPAAEPDWLSPTQIGEKLGITPAKVGRIITKLGLRGNIDGIAKAIVNQAAHSDRTVISFLYSPAAVTQIEEAWKGNGV